MIQLYSRMTSLLPTSTIKPLIPAVIGLVGLLVTSHVYAESSVSVTTNTGNNTINGQSVGSKSNVRIEINGKEYVNDDDGGSYHIEENTDQGKVEVNVNNDKSTSVNQQPTKNEVKAESTAKPTDEPEPTKVEEDEKEEEKTEEKKEEAKNIIEQIKDGIEDLFDKLASLF